MTARRGPIFWNSLSFVHSLRDDVVDRWRGPHGSLSYQRGSGIWIAYLHDACASAGPFPERTVELADGARVALDAALVALRKRVATDQKLLAYLDEEIGPTGETDPAEADLTKEQGRGRD